MSVVAAYHVFVCALFPVQEPVHMYIPALETSYTQIYDMLPQH
jgi:hypothetical protein